MRSLDSVVRNIPLPMFMDSSTKGIDTGIPISKFNAPVEKVFDVIKTFIKFQQSPLCPVILCQLRGVAMILATAGHNNLVHSNLK
eukprot:g24963.t1